jgi:hypothetical protein
LNYFFSSSSSPTKISTPPYTPKTNLLKMESKPHAVFVAFPAQGHLNPMMQLAKLFRCKGFHITFVNTEFNHKRLIKSLGAEFVKGLSDFQFETIPDGLPESDKDATQDVEPLCEAIQNNCYAPFKELVNKLNTSSLHIPITCIIADGLSSFAGRVAKDLGIQELQFWTASACGFVGHLQFDELIKRGILPFKGKVKWYCITFFFIDTVLSLSVSSHLI